MTFTLKFYSFRSQTLLSGSEMEVYSSPEITQKEVVEGAANDICLIKKIELVESLFDHVNEVAEAASGKTKHKSVKRPKTPYDKVHARPIVLRSNPNFIINLRERLAFLNQAKHKELK